MTARPRVSLTARLRHMGRWEHAGDARSAGPRRLPPRAGDGSDDHARHGRGLRRPEDLRPSGRCAGRRRDRRHCAPRQVHRSARRPRPRMPIPTSSSTSPRRAGCAGTTSCPATIIRPGKTPIALRVALSDGSGFDLTEAGTKKSLAVYVVHDPQDVPGHRATRTGPARADLHAQHAGRPDRRPSHADQGRPARPVDPRRSRQRVLRRDPARRADVALRPRGEPDDPKTSIASTPR